MNVHKLKKTVRIVICDIDSTLVTSNHILTPTTKKLIEELHDRGVLFGIASGRPLDEIRLRAKKWGFDRQFDILIGMNGSELWDNVHQKEYSFFKLKREWIKEIIDFMEPFQTNYYIYQDGYLLAKEEDETMQHSANSSDKEIVVMQDVSQMYERENAKIMFRVKCAEDMIPVEEFVHKHPNPNYIGFKTQATLMEFADHRISKAYALEKFCEVNAIALEDVIAFGDTTNDNEMIKRSGLGVCMINGSDDTKDIADDITEKSNDEDGFAHYMRKHILPS